MEKIIDLNGRVMHIDISRRLYQKGDSAIAYKIVQSNEHKGILISNKLKKELKRDLKIEDNYPKLHAIYIYYLIKDNLGLFDSLVICDDEPYLEVKSYLDKLFYGNKNYFEKNITSLHKFRKILGDSKIRSYADNLSNIYRKKAGKPLHRKQKGMPLNIIKVSYQNIVELWKKLK
jgi:hypothetical protein